MLQARIESLQQIADERAETIRDLRTRLDAADARLDRLMLTDRSISSELDSDARRPWWRRWFR
jgi:hypothetical protein